MSADGVKGWRNGSNIMICCGGRNTVLHLKTRLGKLCIKAIKSL